MNLHELLTYLTLRGHIISSVDIYKQTARPLTRVHIAFKGKMTGTILHHKFEYAGCFIRTISKDKFTSSVMTKNHTYEEMLERILDAIG